MYMKTTTAIGMKKPVCANCFEYPENCKGCEFNECVVCKEELTDSECYEYRGAFACAEHLEDMTEKRDFQRQEVTAATEHAVRSQAAGEWANGGYKTMKTDPHTGRPLTKIREPEQLREYERGT